MNICDACNKEIRGSSVYGGPDKEQGHFDCMDKLWKAQGK